MKQVAGYAPARNRRYNELKDGQSKMTMEQILKNKTRFQVSAAAKEIIVVAICWLCMALFLYTAYAKIIDHARFLKGLTRVHLISGLAVFLSFAVPIAEIIIAVLLLVPQTAKTGLYTFITVMISFTVYIVSAMIWEKNLPCHCGGAIEKLSWSQHIWFNLAFVIIAIIALRLNKLNTSLKT